MTISTGKCFVRFHFAPHNDMLDEALASKVHNSFARAVSVRTILQLGDHILHSVWFTLW